VKILHIYRFEPDEVINLLTEAWDEGNEVVEFHLYQTGVDYGRLIDLIFQCDKVLTW